MKTCHGATRRNATKPGRMAIRILALLAATQGVALGLHAGWADRRSNEISVGTDLSSTAILHTDGVMTLGAGRPTLVLAFDVDCAHSRRIAPDWSTWLMATEFRDVVVLAVSPGPISEAASYAREAGWSVRVGSVEPDGSTRGGALTGRTPWVFAVDGAGRVVAEGHGSRIHEVAQALGIETRANPGGGPPSASDVSPVSTLANQIVEKQRLADR